MRHKHFILSLSILLTIALCTGDATAHLPLLRQVRISPNESYTLEKDLPADKVEGWTVCTPETAGGFSSIGYTFASRLQRALQAGIAGVKSTR